MGQIREWKQCIGSRYGCSYWVVFKISIRNRIQWSMRVCSIKSTCETAANYHRHENCSFHHAWILVVPKLPTAQWTDGQKNLCLCHLSTTRCLRYIDVFLLNNPDSWNCRTPMRNTKLLCRTKHHSDKKFFSWVTSSSLYLILASLKSFMKALTQPSSN